MYSCAYTIGKRATMYFIFTTILALAGTFWAITAHALSADSLELTIFFAVLYLILGYFIWSILTFGGIQLLIGKLPSRMVKTTLKTEKGKLVNLFSHVKDGERTKLYYGRYAEFNNSKDNRFAYVIRYKNFRGKVDFKPFNRNTNQVFIHNTPEVKPYVLTVKVFSHSLLLSPFKIFTEERVEVYAPKDEILYLVESKSSKLGQVENAES